MVVLWNQASIYISFWSYWALIILQYLSQKRILFFSGGPRPKKVTEGPGWLSYATSLSADIPTFSPTDRQINDHLRLALLIYLTAARLRQPRLQAGTVGGLKFRPEACTNKVGGESRAKAMTLYSSSAASQSTPRAVTVSGCLTSCLLLSLLSISIHRLTATTNRLQLQVDRGGGRRVVVFAVKH